MKLKDLEKLLLKIGPLVAGAFLIGLFFAGAWALTVFNRRNAEVIENAVQDLPEIQGAFTLNEPSQPQANKNLPLPQGAEVINQDESITGLKISFRSQKPADEVLSFYLSTLPRDGWELTSSTNKITAQKGEKELLIVIIEEAPKETLVEAILTK